MNEQKQHMLNCLAKGVRYDGRKLLEFRPVKIEIDITKSAEGSARVHFGETDLIVGVKMGLESPYPDTPNEGNLMVNVELRPLANPDFELGPPGDQAIELARVVDRGIREAHAINTEKLCLKPGEKVWSVIIDICPINDEGNLFDASSLGAIAALKNSKFPKLKEEGEILKIDYEEKTKNPLPLLKEPISVTVHKIANYFIIDPTPIEERLVDARLTTAVTKENIICALQKGGEALLSQTDVDKMVEIAIEKSQELRKYL